MKHWFLFLALIHLWVPAQLCAQVPSATAGEDKAARFARIQGDVAKATDEQERMKTRITEAQALLDAMLAEPAPNPPPQKPQQPHQQPKPKVPQRVSYRPPFERLTEKKAVGLVCQEGRLSVIDYPALNEAANAALRSKKTSASGELP